MWLSSSVVADLFKKIDRLEAQVAKVKRDADFKEKFTDKHVQSALRNMNLRLDALASKITENTKKDTAKETPMQSILKSPEQLRAEEDSVTIAVQQQEIRELKRRLEYTEQALKVWRVRSLKGLL